MTFKVANLYVLAVVAFENKLSILLRLLRALSSITLAIIVVVGKLWTSFVIHVCWAKLF